MVGQLVSRRRTRRRRLRRPKNVQRQGRKKLPRRHPLVQHRPLRHALLALDHHRTRRGRRLLPPRRPPPQRRIRRRTRERLRHGPARFPTARPARPHDRRLPGRLHVHSRHPIKLGHVLPHQRLLPPFPRPQSQRQTLRLRQQNHHRSARHSQRLRRRQHHQHPVRLATPPRHGRWHRLGSSPPLVLVAHQRLERNLLHDRRLRRLHVAHPHPVRWQQLRRLRQDRPHHHRRHHRRLAPHHADHQARARRQTPPVLPPRPPHHPRLETHRRPSPRHHPRPRPRRQHLRLDRWLPPRLLRHVLYRRTSPPRMGHGHSASRNRGPLRLLHLLEPKSPRLANLLRRLITSLTNVILSVAKDTGLMSSTPFPSRSSP